MTSERARRFAAGLVATEKRIGWGVSVLGFWIQGVWLRRERGDDEPRKEPPDTAEDFADTVRDAIATALDRYEAEAWTAITDDPGSWPQTTDDVLAECAVNDVTRVRACWLAEGRWWTMTNRGVTQIATPTRCRLMPEVPR